MLLTNSQIVQYLADGYKIHEIAKETGEDKRAIDNRIIVLRKSSLSTTVAQLVANYLRNKLIT